jgi:hypothetical protein
LDHLCEIIEEGICSTQRLKMLELVELLLPENWFIAFMEALCIAARVDVTTSRCLLLRDGINEGPSSTQLSKFPYDLPMGAMHLESLANNR